MFEPTYIKDLDRQYTDLCVGLNTIKDTTDKLIPFFLSQTRYAHLTYEELYQMISPSVRTQQYHIWQDSTGITGFANWAFLNPAVLDKYLSTGRLGTLDWQSGKMMCWIEVISTKDMPQMMSWMKNYSVNLLGENVRLYWLRSDQDHIRTVMKIRTKRSWRWAV
jgi:hemolysin-activating ACP:hemolysin acyltransferase